MLRLTITYLMDSWFKKIYDMNVCYLVNFLWLQNNENYDLEFKQNLIKEKTTHGTFK